MNNKEKIEKIRQLLNEYCMDCDIDEYSNIYEKCDDCIAADISKIVGDITTHPTESEGVNEKESEEK